MRLKPLCEVLSSSIEKAHNIIICCSVKVTEILMLSKSHWMCAVNNSGFHSFEAPAFSGRTCAYDGVKIFRGTRITSYPVATVCGNEIPGPISTFGSMLLNFYTDSHIVGLGFLAKYKVICEYRNSML